MKSGIDRYAFFLGTALAIAIVLPIFPANAQAEYPSQPLRMILGFAPGASLDAMARLMAEPMSEHLGQPVIVENRTGASGNLAAEYVARSKPDGHTILFTGSGGVVVNPATYTNLSFDPLKDFTHIGSLGNADIMMAVHPSVPAKTIEELVALTKQEPKRYKYGTSGAGNTMHVVTELFKQRTGAQIEGVHYRGQGPLMPDLLANQVQISFGTPGDFRSHIESGALRGLFVMSQRRIEVLPDVPTAGEMGFPDLNRRGWWGWHAARGVPQPVVDKIRAAIAKGQTHPVVSEKLRAMGVELEPETQAQFTQRIEETLKTYKEIASAANIRIQ
ncbi:Bug family tripartite tricarboxylate transporter substrate binding protein [Ferrovibrio sp.]|uniref:Bug family tripartite tricarboxylate transporter substrate binding protein n=1 Tax=Ferrovibrio sp. TaxID=1917215 RepID=UPI003D29722E